MIRPRKLHGWLRGNAWFAVLLMASIAAADPPKAIITGPTTGKPGDLLVLDASGSDGDFKDWELFVDISMPLDERAKVFERAAATVRSMGGTATPPSIDEPATSMKMDVGDKLVLASYPGKYEVVLMVSNAEGIAKAKWVVKVSGGVTPNPPGPNPPPDPTPQPVGLSALIAAEVAKVVTADSKDAWLAWGTVYDSIANLAESTPFDTVQQFLAADMLARSVPTVVSTKWQTVQENVVAPQLQALADKGGLTTVADYAKTWREIAAGVKTGAGAQPPPVPVVVDPVVPAPIPGAGLRVLIVEETADRGTLPATQQRVFTSTKVLGWLNANAKGNWRIWDKDVDPKLAPSEFAAALAKPRDSVPWILISNGKTGFSGKLPLNEDDVVSLLEKYKP